MSKQILYSDKDTFKNILYSEKDGSKNVLYSDKKKLGFEFSASYSVLAPTSIKNTNDFIWFGLATVVFGRLNKSTGVTNTYSVSGVVGNVRGIEVSESQNLIFLSILVSPAVTTLIQVRSLSNPTTILYSYTSVGLAFGCAYDEINKALYVGSDLGGVRVFRWNSITNILALNATIPIASYNAYGVSYSNEILVVGTNANGTLKAYEITQGDTISAIFIKNIVMARPQARGLIYNSIDNTILASHGSSSNLISIYSYITGLLISEISILNVNSGMGAVIDSNNILWIASQNNNSIIKAI